MVESQAELHILFPAGHLLLERGDFPEARNGDDIAVFDADELSSERLPCLDLEDHVLLERTIIQTHGVEKVHLLTYQPRAVPGAEGHAIRFLAHDGPGGQNTGNRDKC